MGVAELIAEEIGNAAVIQGRDVSAPLRLDADVVVVGSGAGGAAAAYTLAASGLDVIVLEEGGYVRTAEFASGTPLDLIKTLYRDAGSNMILGRPSILFSEGCAVGGSTVINGGMCWRPPAKVLKRWRWELGLTDARWSVDELSRVLDEVEEIIHVAPQSDASVGEDSRRLKAGCDALGYRAVAVSRSQRDCMGSNYCIFGCPTGAKQSTLVSYLPRAVQHGARIYADAKVLEVLVDRSGRATGVRAVITNYATGQKHPCEVAAHAVVVAGGAVQTPVLLRASHLGNRWVGRNLLIHPNVKVLAFYDEEIFGWRGVIQGFQVTEFIEEGLLMATTYAPPSVVAASTPGLGDELMNTMRRINHMVVAGVLVEDSTTGRVRRGPGGQAMMTYQITERDLAQFRRGLALLAEVLFASGARRILLPIESLPAISSADEIQGLYTHPFKPSELEILTVHAMGTARLSADPERGACDERGQLWGHPGLFVADASLLPTSLGVNPQVTIMALATQVAREVADEVLSDRRV